MFSIFKKSKTKEVTELVRLSIGNITLTGTTSGNLNDPSLVELSKKITKSWLETLPQAAINDCQPSILAGYILVAESQVYAEDKKSMELANLYIDAAKLVTKGIGFRAASGQLHESDFKILKIMAQLANKAGLSFYDELLEVAV
jgi:hypothetical protein